MKLAIRIFGTFVLLMQGCHQKDPPPLNGSDRPPATVMVRAIEARKDVTFEELVGTVRAQVRAQIESKVSGRIGEIRVVPGQAVGAGDLLVRLEAPEWVARLDQARARREQAEEDFQRFKQLLERDAATRAEFDAVQARARVAEAAVLEAKTMLGYTELTAPFDGVVTRKLADVGDLATPGKLLLEMETSDRLRLEANVDESLGHRIEIGQRMPVQVRTLEEPIPGTVSEMAPAADPATRTFLVKLDLPPAAGVRSGMFGRVSVPAGEVERLLAPATAVFRRGQLEYLVVMDDGRAQLRLVKVGERHGTDVEVLAGVVAGEQVVVSGASRLREGQRLSVQP